MFSARASWDLSPNDLVLAQQRCRQQGRALTDLTESNPTRIGLRYPQSTVLEALSSPKALLYEPTSLGLGAARQAVSRWYQAQGTPIDSSQLVLTASSSEAYSFLLKLLCDPGDNILVPRPSYPLFDDLSRLESVHLLGYPLRYDDNWRIDMQALQQSITPRSKAVFIVSPNNPTGSYLLCEEREQLEALSRRYGLALVCDEVFSDYVWSDRKDRVRCLAAESQVLSFSLGGLSKAACLPQMKLGWIAVGGPEPLRQEALGRLEVIADTYLSVGAPVQHAAASLLGMTGEIQEQLRCRISQNLKALGRALGPQSPVSVLPVDAGWYALLRVPRTMSDEQWAVLLAEEEALVVHPGAFFGFEDEGFLVIGLIGAPEVFADALGRLAARIERACQ